MDRNKKQAEILSIDMLGLMQKDFPNAKTFVHGGSAIGVLDAKTKIICNNIKGKYEYNVSFLKNMDRQTFEKFLKLYRKM